MKPALRLAIAVVLALASVTGTGGGVLGQDAGARAHYRLEVSLDERAGTIGGTLAVDWPNTTGAPRRAVFFRLYPNAPYYGDGGTTVSSVLADGAAAPVTEHDDATVLEVNLDDEVAPGEVARIELAFETTIPALSDASFGILGGDPARGWWLADWHPILAGWEEGTGWYLAPPTRFGDPTFAESATWELRLDAPAGLTVIGSGLESELGRDPLAGTVTTGIVSAPGRDLTLSLVPGAVTMTAGTGPGFGIVATLPDDLAVAGLGEAIVNLAIAAAPVYEAWLGDFHDGELDVAAAHLVGTPAVAWNGVIWLELEAIAADGALDGDEEDRLRFTLLHEVCHQWLHGIVGSNNNDHGFMSEGLANALAILAARELYGSSTAEAWLRDRVAAGYLAMVESGEDGSADAVLTEDTDPGVRSQLVYGKAALGFEAIRQAVGDEAFFGGLAAYAEAFRFEVSAPGDLRAAWEEASGLDLGALWRDWFEDDRTTVAEVQAVLDGFA